MIDIKDMRAGESYATRFRVEDYEGLGVVETRDVEQQLLQVVDVDSGLRFVVSWDNCWDVDVVEWQIKNT